MEYVEKNSQVGSIRKDLKSFSGNARSLAFEEERVGLDRDRTAPTNAVCAGADLSSTCQRNLLS